MNKKKIIFIAIFASILAILFQLIYSYKTINKSLVDKKIYTQNEKVQKAFKGYEVIQCNFDLKNPEHAFVSFQHYVYPERNVDMKSFNVDFYKLIRGNIFSINWDIEYTGGTTVKNTTFDEVLTMVKEDCSQFQEPYYDLAGYESYEDLSDDEQLEVWPKISRNNLNWSYSPAPAQKEIDADTQGDIESLLMHLAQYSPEAQEVFKEIYGDVDKMSDEDRLAVIKRMEEEVWEDERVFRAEMIASFHRGYAQITKEERQMIIDTYGESLVSH